MKKLRKVLALVLAMVMVLGMSTMTAFAANNDGSLTLTKAVPGEEYKIYKVFDLTYSGSGDDKIVSYSYTKSGESDGLYTALSSDTSPFKLTESTVAGTYMVELKNEETSGVAVSEFFKTIETQLQQVIGKGTTGLANDGITATATTVKWENLDYGYYYVTTSLGSLMTIDSTTKDASIEEKNTLPTPTKATDEASKDAEIGDTVGFTVTWKDGKGTDTAVTLKDTLSQGLTLQKNSFKVTFNNADVDKSSYEITYPAEAEGAANDAPTFQIVFTADYVKQRAENDVVTITYNAIVNEKATYNTEETNKLTLIYSNQTSTEVSSKVNTYKFEVLKYANGDKTKNLADAVFELKNNGTIVNLVYVDATHYRVATAAEIEEATKNNNIKDFTVEGTVVRANDVVKNFITVSTENIEINGVDVDQGVNYTLVETKAPQGYNMLTTPVDVTVNTTNDSVVEIENNAGSTLPSTGGMGTTLFYIFGAVFVIGAGIVLVTRRRMAK